MRGASRVRAGARAKAGGDAFEDRLKHQHDAYRLLRTIYVVPVPQPVRRIRTLGKGQFVACYEGEGPPDYMGILDEVPVVFDAKSTASTTWGYGLLKEHQAVDLDDAEFANGFGFILLSMVGAVWVIPWKVLGPMWWAWRRNPGRAAAGTASLSVADADRIGRRCSGVDWVPVVRSLLAAKPGAP
jgi:penicillin-binding protein-related factor A (putative recombinase)